MDKTSKVFDIWAKAGRAEEMEEGHGVTVGKFLGSISFDKPFSFLDIGCGNGWVVRKIAQLPKCKKAGRCSSQCRWSLRRLCADPGFSR